MKVTDVRIYPFDTAQHGGRIRAIADVELDSVVIIKGIRILESRSGGLFLGMPSIRTRSGTYRDLVVLKDKDFASQLRDCILSAYETTGSRELFNDGGSNE